MTRNEEFISKKGQDVEEKIIKELKTNFYLTSHAEEQLQKRSHLLVSKANYAIDYVKTKDKIREAIDERVLAYYNTDGTINIAINEWNYFVFAYCEKSNNWALITYKEMSWNSKNIFEKQQMAKQGYERKETK